MWETQLKLLALATLRPCYSDHLRSNATFNEQRFVTSITVWEIRIPNLSETDCLGTKEEDGPLPLSLVFAWWPPAAEADMSCSTETRRDSLVTNKQMGDTRHSWQTPRSTWSRLGLSVKRGR